MTGNLRRRLNARVFLFLPQSVRATQMSSAGRMVFGGSSQGDCVASAISIRRHFLLRCG